MTRRFLLALALCVAGGTTVAAGLAMIYVPAALVFAGAAILAGGLLIELDPKRESR